jgi:hypothetical protein
MRIATSMATSNHARIGCVGVALFTLFTACGCEKCDRFEEVLAQDARGRRVISVLSACTSPYAGTELDQSIYVEESPGHRDLAFRFGPNPGIVVPRGLEPTSAKWLSPNELQIRVGAITDIREQKQSIGHLKVAYDIGTVIPSAGEPPNKSLEQTRDR